MAEETDSMEKSETLLGELESRMAALSDLVVSLRNDNTDLSKKMADADERQAGLEQDNADLSAKIADLMAQKEKIILKLESLLARFSGSEQ